MLAPKFECKCDVANEVACLRSVVAWNYMVCGKVPQRTEIVTHSYPGEGCKRYMTRQMDISIPALA